MVTYGLLVAPQSRVYGVISFKLGTVEQFYNYVKNVDLVAHHALYRVFLIAGVMAASDVHSSR